MINEIEQLIVAARAELGRSPYDSSIQTELKALLDLQTVLKARGTMLSQEQLVPVKTQVATLAVKYRASNAHQTVTPTPPIHAPPFHAPMQHPPQPIAPVAPVPPPAPAPAAAPAAAAATPAAVSLDALLGKGALAALLNRRSVTPQAPAPHLPPAPVAALRSPTPQKVEPRKSATPDPLALLGALRGAGLIPPPPHPASSTTPSGTTPVNKSLAPPPAPYGPSATAAAGGVPPVPMNLASILASARSLAAASALPVITSGEFSLTASSLKQYVSNYITVALKLLALISFFFILFFVLLVILS